MKFKKTILAFVATIFLLGLASCGKNLDSVTTKLTTIARRDKITVVADFTDEESRIFASITPTVYLYDYEDNKKGEEVESKTLQNAGDINNIGKETQSQSVTFENLEETTKDKVKEYQVVVKATVDGYAYELASKVVGMSDKGTKDNPIVINDIDGFLEVQHDRDGYYKLDADLDFSELVKEGETYKLTPMFTTESNSFKGSFDGQNHTLKNFKIEANNQYNGFIGYLEGKLHNLKLENVEITTSRTSEINTGLLVGYNAGSVLNCEVKNSKVTVESTAYSLTYPLIVGGLVGTVAGDNSDIAVQNCKATDIEIKVEARHRATVGGMIGQVLAPKTIRMGQNILDNTLTNLTLTVKQENKTSTKDDILVYVGGFVGATARTISNSSVEGNSTITVTAIKSDAATYKEGLKTYNVYVGGFAGQTVENSRGGSLANVKFEGSIKADLKPAYTAYVGGLIGAMKGIGVENSIANLKGLEIDFHTEAAAQADAEEKETYVAAYGLLIGYANKLDVAGNTVNSLTPTLTGTYTETKLNSQK